MISLTVLISGSSAKKCASSSDAEIPEVMIGVMLLAFSEINLNSLSIKY